ncbi:dihydrofolate reductase family protein [Nocardioides sp.]|uniref:dihydrofolate reductase family protein n=1 Tax=Nocardioides sp. TaxID=35761 RepID=UPI0035294568
MRILLGLPGAPDTEGAALPEGAYAWPDETPWTRVTMLRTLDGGVAGPDGRSRSVSSDLDRDVLAEVRRLADAVVIGAQTLRVERYGPMRARDDAVEERRSRGQHDAPQLVVVSGSLDLPWQERVFSDSALTPIVVTGADASPDALSRARDHATVLQLDDETVTATALLAALHDRGLRRVVCEGGPGLLGDFAREDAVDEVCLTLAPYQPALVPAGDDSSEPRPFDLAQLLEHQSFLFARYVRQGRRR